MLIPYILSLVLWLVRFNIDSFKNVLESSIILFQNGIFSGHIKGILSLKGKFKAAVSKILNTLVDIVHSHTDSTFSLEFVDFHLLLFSLCISEDDFESSGSVDCEICGSVLISESMSADNNGFFPSWN